MDSLTLERLTQSGTYEYSDVICAGRQAKPLRRALNSTRAGER